MTEFSDLGLSPTTLKAVADTGYTTATPIQASAIPVALAGRDVLGIAQTGTGKTAAFTLPMVDRLHNGRAKARMPRALVLAPTRELADQVAASFEKYAKGTRLSWALLIGGVSMGDQVSALDKGVDVLIATPGRLLDLFERGKLMMNGVQMLVVDEADRMLDMGFIPDIERIFKMTPPGKQTLFFSATMPPEITRLTQQFLKDPTRIEATRPATTNADIKQYIVPLPSSDPKHKRTALRALVGREDVKNGIVFCNRKSEVDVVAKSLKVHGFDAAPIHGDLDQSTRMKTLDAFRKGELAFLCASDVAARGLDIPDVSHVFNYDVPHHADDYVHRIGRTGRAGKKGQTFMLTTPADARSLDKVLSLIKVSPETLDLEIDWSSVPKDDPSRKRERDQSRSRGRDKDGRGRGRPASETSTVAMAPISVDEVEKAKETRPEPREESADAAPRGDSGRRDRGRRPRREEAAPVAESREAAPPRQAEPRADHDRRPRREDAPASDRRDHGRDHGEDRKVVGFGSDLPAFMRR